MNFCIELDPKVRCIVLYQDAHWPSERIAYTLNIPERTIRDWISKLQQGIDIRQRKERQGRKSTTTQDLKERVIRDTRRKPAASSTRNLAGKYAKSPSTIHHILTEKKFVYGNTKMEIELDAKVEEKRVKFCQKMLKRKGTPIDETFFSDEMGIKLSEAKPKKAWSGPYKKVKVENPPKDIKVNCWGAISRNGATSLEIFKDNLKADSYQQIVQKHQQEMFQAFPEGVKYTHDNSSIHKSAEENLQNDNFQILEFPTYSPDLNPIENLWSTLKGSVRRDAPKTEKQLVNSLKRNWQILTQPNNLKPYFDSLHTRYQECIDKKGVRLDY